MNSINHTKSCCTRALLGDYVFFNRTGVNNIDSNVFWLPPKPS